MIMMMDIVQAEWNAAEAMPDQSETRGPVLFSDGTMVRVPQQHVPTMSIVTSMVQMIQIVQDATARGTAATIVALNGPRHQQSHNWYNFQRLSVAATAAAWTKSRRTSVGMVIVDQVLRQ
jgi:hypothetical protein